MPWIIGDIHGCVDELNELLEHLPKEDHLIFVGDYVDRGPDSHSVVERLIQEKHRATYLMGNHEDMMLNFLKDPENIEGMSWLYDANGGRETMRSYGFNVFSRFHDLPETHQDFFNNLLIYYEGEDFLVVHAGLRISAGRDLKKQRLHDLLWIRNEWINKEALWEGKLVYYGHTPSRYILGFEHSRSPILGARSIGLDTGCVYGGYLTAMHHPSKEMVQIESKTKWPI